MSRGRNVRQAVLELLSDIRVGRRDLDYVRRGGRIFHAVDFSEVYSFVVPSEGADNISAVPGLTRAEKTALNARVVHTIFFGQTVAQEPPLTILLAPYRLELRNSAPRFYRRAIEEFRRVIIDAHREAGELKLEADVRRLVDELESGEGEQRRRVALQQELTKRFKEDGSLIYLLTVDHTSWSVEGRLRKLLEHARLCSVEESGLFDGVEGGYRGSAGLFEKVFRLLSESRVAKVRAGRWRNKEAQRRALANAHGTSQIDAIAFDQIVALNDLLVGDSEKTSRETRRIVLVSRSEHLHAAIEQYARENQHDRVLEFIRRPRAFCAGFLQVEDDIEKRGLDLAQSERSLGLAQERLQDGAALARSDLDEFERHWKEAINLIVASGDWDTARETEFARVIGVLRDRHQLNAVLRDSAAKLQQEIDLSSALLGRFSSKSVEDAEILMDEMQQAEPVFVWSKTSPSTIGLYFFHPIVREAKRSNMSGEGGLRRLLQAARGTVVLGAEIGHPFVEDESPMLIETCIASGFFEAVQGRWDLAKIFADMALSWREQNDRTPRCEAFYFKALCLRRQEEFTERDGEEALQLLSKATEIVEQLGVSESLCESMIVRYKFERGVSLVSMWEFFERGVGTNVENSSRATEANKIFESAYEWLRDETEKSRAKKQMPGGLARFLMDVANARCYLAIYHSSSEEKLLRSYMELRDAIRMSQWGDDMVPLGVLDTKCWALFQLRKVLRDHSELAVSVRVLEERVKAESHSTVRWRTRKDLDKMGEHVAVIKEELSGDL